MRQRRQRRAQLRASPRRHCPSSWDEISVYLPTNEKDCTYRLVLPSPAPLASLYGYQDSYQITPHSQKSLTRRLVVEGDVGAEGFDEVDLGLGAGGRNDLQALLLGELDNKTTLLISYEVEESWIALRSNSSGAAGHEHNFTLYDMDMIYLEDQGESHSVPS